MGRRPLARLACPELVGRDEEIATIAQRASSAASGDGSVILISGEAGLGKTAMLGHAAGVARRAGLRVLRAECERLEMRRAFGPFIDGLRAIREPGPAVRNALSTMTASAARTVGMDSGGDRYTQHAAFARAYAELAEEKPLFVAIDDLHWADDATLELFTYLARRLGRSALLIGAFRPEEVKTRAVARRALADLPHDRLWELRLRPLTDEDAARAIRLTLGDDANVNTRGRDFIRTRCAGNPLFMEEILRALARRGDLQVRDGAWHLGDISSVPLPATVAEAVRERVDPFDSATQEILSYAAVLGERFEFDTLAAATGADASALLSFVRSATAAGLIVEEDAAHLAFRHPLVREAILQRLLQRERRERHARVAAVLERNGGSDEWLGLIAYHWDEAGQPERAFEFHRRAGSDARARKAYAEALRHFERALVLAPEDDRTKAELFQRVGEMYSVLGPPLRALEHIDQARRLYERLGDAQMVGHMLLASNAIGQRTSWTDQQRTETVNRAFTALRPLGDTPELAWAQAVLALLALDRNDVEGAHVLANDAVATGARCGKTWQLANAYQILATLRLWSGDAEGALSAGRLAVETADGVAGGGARMDLFTLDRLNNILKRIAPDSEEHRAVAQRQRELAERYGVGVGESRGDITNLNRLHRRFYIPAWDEYRRLHDEHVAEYGGGTFDAAHLLTHRSFIEVARSGLSGLERLEHAIPLMTAREGFIGNFVHIMQVYLLAERYQDALAIAERIAHRFEEGPRRIGSLVTGDVGICALVAATATDDDTSARLWMQRLD